MAKLTGEQIQAVAREVLLAQPKGMRWMELLRAVESQHPETPHNTIHGSVHKFLNKSEDVLKVARGTYLWAGYQSANDPPPAFEPVKSALATEQPSHLEHLYYEGFAEFLKEELEDVDRAIALGGNVLKGKWGTPDVIGVRKPQTSDLIKFEPQIVSAEIKTDTNAPVVAFGQAVAYRLFSHKSYMVMPNTTAKADMSRLDALAAIYGIGLVTFALNPDAPEFTLRVRATPSQPDLFYMNEMARRVLDHSKRMFDSLF